MGIGLYKSASDSRTAVAEVGIGAAVARIRESPRLASLTAAARRIRESGGEEAYRDFKTANIPAVTWAGNFPNARKAGAAVVPSGLVFVESDHLHGGAAGERGRLAGYPQTAVAYVSTGGDGVHAAVRVSPPPADAGAYKAAWAFVRDALGLAAVIDAKASDISRLAFLAHDPGAYANPSASALAWEYPPEPKTEPERRPPIPNPPANGGGADWWIQSALAVVPSENYADWLAVGMALKDGESKGKVADGFALWDSWSASSAKYGGAEATRKKWDSFNGSGTTLGTLWRMASELGWIPPKRGGRGGEGERGLSAAGRLLAARAEASLDSPPGGR